MPVSRRWCIGFAFAAMLCGPAAARAAANGIAPWGAHLEGGFGAMAHRTHAAHSGAAASFWAGASARLRGPVHAAVEYASSAALDLGSTYYFDLGGTRHAQDRTLESWLVGCEWRSDARRDGPFLFVGAGTGRETPEGGYGVYSAPLGTWSESPRDRTGLALGAGAGCRLPSGPGPTDLSLALRMQMMPSRGHLTAAASALTLGVAY